MNKKPIIDLIVNESGDWSILKLDGEVFAEGHSITQWDWTALIYAITGVGVNKQIIKDKSEEIK